jgi:ankyrin repeat protein
LNCSQGGTHRTALEASLAEPACWEIVHLLLANPNTTSKNLCADLNYVLKVEVPKNANIFHNASISGEIEVVELLLKKGADPNDQGANFASPRTSN